MLNVPIALVTEIKDGYDTLAADPCGPLPLDTTVSGTSRATLSPAIIHCEPGMLCIYTVQRRLSNVLFESSATFSGSQARRASLHLSIIR